MEYVKDGEGYVPDKLFTSIQIPAKVSAISLKGAQGTLLRGSVIALDTNKKGGLLDKENITDVAYGILTDDIITGTTITDYVIAEVYVTGDFNSDSLILAEGTTLEEYATELRKLGIYTDTIMEG